MPASWFVAVTVPRAERIAKEQYLRLNIRVFLPLRERPPTVEKPLVVEPVWPGYIFIGEPVIPTAERLFFAASDRIEARYLAPAVRGLISADGEPLQMPPGFVEGWIAKADADGLVSKYEPVAARPFERGDTVQILYGTHTGAFAKVEWSRGEKLKLIGSCFNREIPIYVVAEQVALAEEAA